MEEAANEMVLMSRHEPQFAGGPTTADVPRSEVENYQRAGWAVDEAKGSTETKDDRSGDQAPSVSGTNANGGPDETATGQSERPSDVIEIKLDDLDKSGLLDLANAEGIEVKSTWGEDRLRTEIRAAIGTE